MRRFSSSQFEEPFPEIADMIPATPFDVDMQQQQQQHQQHQVQHQQQIQPQHQHQHQQIQHQQQQQQLQPQPQHGQGTGQGTEEDSIDHGHKLLSFSVPAYNFTLLDYSLRRTSLNMTAQLHGMFFLAESSWSASPGGDTPVSVNTAAPAVGMGMGVGVGVGVGPAELTCYRRNLFQITGSVTLPRTLRYIMTEQGDRIPILAQELTVSATESVEGNPVKIISVPWKTPAGGSSSANASGSAGGAGVGGSGGGSGSGSAAGGGMVEDKTEKEPAPVVLDTMGGQDADADFATFSIAWKRLQFRIATANNGRRRELQQHFVLRLKIVATLSTGAKISICESQSGPIIVRGRSPRNFQSRKDVPLSGSAAASRKNTQAAALARANAGGTPANPAGSVSAGGGKRNSPVKTEERAAAAAVISDPSAAAAEEEEESRSSKRRRMSSGIPPITLTFNDEEASSPHSLPIPELEQQLEQPERKRSTSHYDGPLNHHPLNQPLNQHHQHQHHPLNQHQHQPQSNHHQNHHQNHQLPAIMGEAEDRADVLYEYFPLALEEWQAPVDAVYRPHVVHHTALAGDAKALAARRSKVYFES
ncbi:transcriptional regulator PacG/VIB-1 [Trichophyton verrucosum HKI 0517]|uniref:Transcriptional regulator PacG/VIB-1 n=1 Tax=Trichophyton verrucosum (strain HKI 0517) TaxID=663202 RepID=D4DKZ4_TRIVH|nr:transcriptional regulator PacG/VIB-1 [Trichophyton verrucosum HKI 0517]EFE37527.1 transcriptional regulator PacG/VIB-1 [Trichophyton verrucosum HKI 0517]